MPLSPTKVAGAGAALLAALTVAACGSSGKSSSSSGSTPAPPPASTPAGSPSTPATSGQPVALSISELGQKASYVAPPTIPGGLVTLQLSNKGSKPHAAQLLLLRGGHTTPQALKVIGSESNVIPAWIRFEGGVSSVAPAQTASAVVNLPPGHYLLLDPPGPGSQGPPAYRDVTVTAGTPGSLPATAAKATAHKLGKDRYTWRTSGLKAGLNQVTFKSEGANAVHQITVVRLNPGANPSVAQIGQALKKEHGPPPFVDRRSLRESGTLDGGRTQVASLDLRPGTYILLCHWSDRDGGKQHYAEGMLTKVSVS